MADTPAGASATLVLTTATEQRGWLRGAAGAAGDALSARPVPRLGLLAAGPARAGVSVPRTGGAAAADGRRGARRRPRQRRQRRLRRHPQLPAGRLDAQPGVAPDRPARPGVRRPAGDQAFRRRRRRRTGARLRRPAGADEPRAAPVAHDALGAGRRTARAAVRVSHRAARLRRRPSARRTGRPACARWRCTAWRRRRHERAARLAARAHRQLRASGCRATRPTPCCCWPAALLVLAPHAGHLPPWVSALCATTLAWRAAITLRGTRLPPALLLLPLAVAAMGGVSG